MAENDLQNIDPDEFWRALSEGKDVQLFQSAMDRPITEDDIYALLGRYPYVEITDPNNRQVAENAVPEIIASEAGWLIHDYGNLLRATAGEANMGYRKQTAETDDEAGGEAGGASLERHGTLVNQGFLTAINMAAIAYARWQGAHINRGYYPLQRAIWIAAETIKTDGKDFNLTGFDASIEDDVVRYWAKEIGGLAEKMRKRVEEAVKYFAKPHP